MPKTHPTRYALKALLLGVATTAVAAVIDVPGANAQGWWDGGYGDNPRWYRRGGRAFEVYPDNYSDEDIEDAERRRRHGRRYAPPPRWNDRYEDRDDDRDDDDDVDEPRNRREVIRRPVPPAAAAEPQKPVAPASGEFAPGARPFIRAEAPPVVAFSSSYPVGSIVIDSSARKLYYVRGRMSAFAYPIGVGRDGFSWVGSEKVSRVADWPDWYPPAEMRKRQPQLPERMLGGLNNPLGAKAIYLGNTLYRIHGTNDPTSIGKAKSSGCFRMLNKHVLHLASLVEVGTQVTVVPSLGRGLNIVSAPAPRERVTARSEAPPVRRPPRVRWSADPDPYPYDDRFDDDGDYRYRYR